MNNSQPQQTGALSGTQQLLRAAEVEFCRLRADKEALEIRLSELGASHAVRAKQIREELRAIVARITATQVELMDHHATLLREQLPQYREAVGPLKDAFDQAEREYREAYKNREGAALALHDAQLKVGNAESNVEYYESSAERLRKQLSASQESRARLASEIAGEITGLEGRLRELRTMTPLPPVADSGSIG